MKTGTLLKMKSNLNKSRVVEYSMPVGSEEISLNGLIGKKLKIKHTGNIYCVDTGKKIKKSYHNGYCYESFISKAACDVCILQPEKCHYHLGTCREPSWGEKNCMRDHVVYLSYTSGLKVGITRLTQVPYRWIDQGATHALEVARVPNRFSAGLVEVLLKGSYGDKTQWKKMLNGVDVKGVEELLLQERNKIWSLHHQELDKAQAIKSESDVETINFPVEAVPAKFTSFSFDKENEVCETLMGIKGQYLIFESRVLNIRRHQGYEVEFSQA